MQPQRMDDRDRAEVKQHMSVLAEQFQTHLKPVIEAVEGVGGKVDRLDAKVERLDSRVDRVEVRLDSIEHRLDAFEKRVVDEFQELRAVIKLSYAELDRRLSALETGYSELRDRIERIEGAS